MATWSASEADPLAAFSDEEVTMILGSAPSGPPPALVTASKAAMSFSGTAGAAAPDAAPPSAAAAAAAAADPPPAWLATRRGAAGSPGDGGSDEADRRVREGLYGQHVIDGYPLLRMASFEQLGLLLKHDEKAADDERKSLRLALLGGELMERERLDDAEALLKRAFKIYKDLTGLENIAILLRMGCLYQQKLNLPIAIKFFEKGLQVAEERGAPDPTLLFGHIGLASSYRMSADMDKAEAYCNKLLTDGFVTLSQPIERAHLRFLVLNLQAEILLHKGRYTFGILKLVEALRVRKENEMVPLFMSQSYHLLARVYRMLGLYEQAARMIEQNVLIFSHSFGPESLDVSMCLSQLGEIRQCTQQWDEAVKLYRYALRLSQKFFGPIHPKVASIFFMLGETYAAAGKYAESVRYLRRAIAIIETYEIQTNCDHGLIVADYYYSLYMVCLVWQRYGEARRYLRWAASILETLEDDTDSEQLRPHLAVLRAELAKLRTLSATTGSAVPVTGAGAAASANPASASTSSAGSTSSSRTASTGTVS